MQTTVPDYANAALGDLASLPPNAFAAPADRQYPMHTKAATWQSYKAAMDGGASAVVFERLDEAARLHQITPDCERLRAEKRAASQTMPSQFFGLPDRRQYPLDQQKDAEQAVGYLQKHARTFSYDDRRVFAGNILDAAARLGMTLPADKTAWLEKRAGRGFCLRSEALECIRLRELHADADARPKLAALQQHLTGVDMKPAQLVKLAAALDEVDHECNLSLPQPEEMLFSMPFSDLQKTASEHVELLDGTVFQKSALAAINSEAVRNWLGDDMAEALCGPIGEGSISKMAEVLPTLPRSDIKSFLLCARSCGVQPIPL